MSPLPGSWLSAVATVLLVVGGCCVRPAAAHYCATHHFADAIATNAMQFTKEVVSQEYATLKEYKSLHCCAKGYQSIEWFLNGKPYPWSHDTSTLILDPAAENQTIYTRTIANSDAGNYTCVLRNATHKREHRMVLFVKADSPDTPLPTFRPLDISVELHKPVRLFCEAFVGHVKLPDAHSMVTWTQVSDGQQTPVGHGAQVNVNREGNQIVGAYLNITHMHEHNYGRYVCRIDIGNAANRLEMSVQITGPPTQATNLFWSMTPLQLVLSAAVLTFGVLVLLRYTLAWYAVWHKREGGHCQARNTSGGGGLLAAGDHHGSGGVSDGDRCGDARHAEKFMRNVV